MNNGKTTITLSRKSYGDKGLAHDDYVFLRKKCEMLASWKEMKILGTRRFNSVKIGAFHTSAFPSISFKVIPL